VTAIPIVLAVLGVVVGLVLRARSPRERSEADTRRRRIVATVLIAAAAVLLLADTIASPQHRYLKIALLVVIGGGFVYDYLHSRMKERM
jgi:heme/copper-type cytochrome/quinol oxidase subunit 2